MLRKLSSSRKAGPLCPAGSGWLARALAAAPVRKGDGVVLGALCLIHDEVRELDGEELTLLETLAAEVAERLTGEEAAPVSEPEAPTPSATVGQQIPD